MVAMVATAVMAVMAVIVISSAATVTSHIHRLVGIHEGRDNGSYLYADHPGHLDLYEERWEDSSDTRSEEMSGKLVLQCGLSAKAAIYVFMRWHLAISRISSRNLGISQDRIER